MAFGNGLDHESEVLAEINMTPLVDVMLVLLIIFIITVPVITHAVKVELPQATSQPAETQPDTIIISVNSDGKVYWQNEQVSRQQLQLLLDQNAVAVPQPGIHLHGDGQASYQHIIDVMAAAQQAGLVKLGFITTPSS